MSHHINKIFLKMGIEYTIVVVIFKRSTTKYKKFDITRLIKIDASYRRINLTSGPVATMWLQLICFIVFFIRRRKVCNFNGIKI